MRALLRKLLYTDSWLSKVLYQIIYQKWITRYKSKKDFIFFNNVEEFIDSGNLMEYSPCQKVVFKAPFGKDKTGLPNLFKFYLDQGEISLDKEEVCIFSKAYLLGNEAVGVDEGGRIISDTALDEPVVLHKCNPRLIMNYDEVPSDLSFDWCCSLVNIFSSNTYSNYFHWLTDSLILIQAVKYLENTLGQKIRLIVPKNRTKYQNEYLRFLGYESEQLIEWNYKKVEVNNLVVVKSRRIGINRDEVISPLGLNWLKTSVLPSVSLKDKYGENIFIVRKGNVARKIINQKELVNELSIKGYQFVDLDTLNVSSQIALFYHAKNIISAHGAGLVNMIFSNKGTRVIELLGNLDNENDYYWYAAYFSLANVLGHQYSYLKCETFPIHKDRSKMRQLYDIKVDISSLNELLDHRVDA